VREAPTSNRFGVDRRRAGGSTCDRMVLRLVNPAPLRIYEPPEYFGTALPNIGVPLA
jgi:hypothetical protein